LALAAIVWCLPYAASAEAPASGKLKDKVVQALKSISDGTCPESLMGALLLTQCEQQLTNLKSRLSALGTLKEARYKGLESLPTGVEAEVYLVSFEKGSMTWLAAPAPSGKLSVFWSPG
jgi:hypothetical protein